MKSLSIATLLAASAAIILLTASPLAAARDHVNWSINVGAPAVAYQSYPVYASPVYTAPPVVYARPQPVYVEPAPVYYSQPRVVAPAPVYQPGYQPVYQPVYYGYYGAPRHWHHGHHGYNGHNGHNGYYDR